MKKNHTAQNKTVAIARFSQSVGCCRQAQVVFFSIHCVIGGVKTRRVPLFGGAPPGFVGSAPQQQRRRGSASVAQRPRGTNGHTHKSAQLCACAWLEGGRGGGVDGFVEWGRRGWMVLEEEEEEGKERKTHTANEKNKCTMKKKKTSAAAIIQNKTFNSLS